MSKGGKMRRIFMFAIVSSIILGGVAVAYAACDCTLCHGLMHNNCSDWGADVCNSCHGDPPQVNAPGQNGLVLFPSPTGSTAVGGHATLSHRYGGNAACQHCHSGGMPVSPVIGNNKIQIGFNAGGFSGSGSSYDGHTLNSPYSYEGTNGTTITMNGSGTCSNLYCHSDGTAVSTGIINSNSAPPWSSASGTSETLACNSCHGFPPSYSQDAPKANSHVVHNYYVTCDMCHYATTNDGTHISTVELNANGTYDISPNPSKYFTLSGQSTVVNFSYAYDVGGGTCSNISCHQLRSINPNQIWGGVRPQLGSSASCQNTGNHDGTEICSISGIIGNGPFTYMWNFADGATATTQQTTHQFKSTEALNVRVTVRDVNKHALTTTANVAMPDYPAPVASCPQGIATLPVIADTLSLNGNVVTLTDTSFVCNTASTTMWISWGDNAWPTYYYGITQTPTSHSFTHTYTTHSGAHYSLCVSISNFYGFNSKCYDAGI
jgi:predicted CxxxxCH...CXXCH cytochrome family protein